MSQLKPLKKYLIGSTALIGGSFFVPATALAVSCPTNITDSSLAGVVCDFNSGSSVTTSSPGNVGGLNMTFYNPASPSFILNNGTIANPTGVAIMMSGSSLSGGITNNGHITSGAGAGIFISNTSTLSGGINNTGTIISSGGTGILINNASTINGGISNSGTISSSSVFAGLVISNISTINGNISNTGIIQATGTADGILIRSNSNITGSINNTGTISGYSGLTVMNVSNITGDISNAGTISGTTIGISLHNAAALGGNLLNSGTISGGNIGIDVFSAMTISGGINNSGTISGGNTGIRIASTATISGGIQNSGTISGAINAINIDASSNVNSINLLGGGRIIGNIQAPNTNLNINGGQIEGNSNVNLLNINTNFTTHGNFTATGTTIGSGDKLTIRAGDTLTGDFTSGTDGTLAFGVSNGTFGKIIGNANLTGANIAVDLGNASLLHNGDEMKVIQGSTPLTGGPGGTLTAISDNSYLWNFQMVDGTGATTPTNSNDLFIRANRASASSLGFNQADTNTYNALQTFADANTSDPVMLRVLGNLNSTPTQGAAQNILQSVEPTLNGSDFIGAQTLNNQTLNMAGEQLAMLHNGGETGMAAGNNLKGLRIWGQMFDAEANQGEHEGIKGYSANSWGGAVGIDTRNINDKTILGLALSSGQTNANSKNANHTGTDVNSYQLTLYGDYAFTKDTFASSMLAYGWQNVDTTRYDIGGTGGPAAHGSFNTNEVAARTELGKNYLYGSTLVTPSILANYLHYSPDSYTETGAGSMNLHIDRKDMDVLELGVGTKLSRTYQRADGVLTPSIHGGWRYDVIGDHLNATNSFAAGGPTFDTQGIQPGRSTLDMGASMKYVTNSNIELTANYEFQHKTDYTSNAGFVRAAYKF